MNRYSRGKKSPSRWIEHRIKNPTFVLQANDLSVAYGGSMAVPRRGNFSLPRGRFLCSRHPASYHHVSRVYAERSPARGVQPHAVTRQRIIGAELVNDPSCHTIACAGP
jgi:hypothetical protein